MKLLQKLKYLHLFLLYGNSLEKLVKQEAKSLRNKATEEELSKLDFETLTPVDHNDCIYGQMTGSCYTERANELIFACATRVYNINKDRLFLALDECQLNGTPREVSLRETEYFSPIEKFIAQKKPNQATNNELLIAYLKGERETLEFV